MDYVVVAVGWVVAVVFAVSAFGKLRSRRALEEFVSSLRPFGLAPGWRRPVGVAVALGEAAVPVVLGGVVVGPVSVAASRSMVGMGFALGLVLLGGFTVSIARALGRCVRTSCRCFGTSTTPLGRAHLVRNGLLLTAAGLGLVGALGGGTSPPNAGGVAVVLLAGSVAGALVTAFDDLVELFSPTTRAGSPDSLPS